MRASTADTICAIATPLGRGALGIVRLSGPEALGLLRRATGVDRFAPRRARLVRLREPEASETTVDQVLATYFATPRSYTGEEMVEVSAHGGELNVRRVLELFVGLGARLAEPGEFTRRAFVNGRLDLSQAEAVAEVIAARSERALRNAHALLDGQLGRRVRDARQRVVALAAELEACIDFADEADVVRPVMAELGEVHRGLVDELSALASSYQRGRRLGGVCVGLTGVVNAGKSSLFNALLGSERALVSQLEGTTRDYLEAEVEWDGLAVTLVDTAGTRPVAAGATVAPLERAGLALGAARVAECDVLVEVVDLAAEGRVVGAVEGVVAANKVDLLPAPGRDERLAALAAAARDREVVAVSALSGEGLEGLRRAVLRRALGENGKTGTNSQNFLEDEIGETVSVTSARHHRALVAAVAALAQGRAALEAGQAPELVVEHAREALEALGEITGERFTEDVLDVIFSRFCIGK